MQFSNVDTEVINSVLDACEGSVNSAIEFLLSISESTAHLRFLFLLSPSFFYICIVFVLSRDLV